ncbi:MAG: DUF3179 domain-containing protein [Candidatus Omnitrophica bacterium]|nr:DUF3179 domain-containing protein [Candidatus Omnitrophota bacterium]
MNRSPQYIHGQKIKIAGVWSLIFLSAILALLVLFLQIRRLSSLTRSNMIGDGKNVETYGFDFSNCSIHPDEILAAGMPKNGVPVLDAPLVMTPDQVEALNQEERGKYLVPGDRVIGVEINGESRAYPLRVLNWHEIVNDVLGHQAIAVTYSPLCDSAAVYDRSLDGHELRFGVSGLVYNSNPLIYDRQTGGAGESLWIQLLGQAIAGPHINRRLKVIPCSLLSWEAWKQLHPDTTVLKPDPARKKLYRKQYGNYFGSDDLRFPVKPLPPEGETAKKTPVLIVRIPAPPSETRKLAPAYLEKVFFYDDVAANADASGLWKTEIGQTALHLRYYDHPPAVALELNNAQQNSLEIRYAFWFAWYALTHPGSL